MAVPRPHPNLSYYFPQQPQPFLGLISVLMASTSILLNLSFASIVTACRQPNLGLRVHLSHKARLRLQHSSSASAFLAQPQCSS